mgnify:CR=1 FL=1
MFEIYVTVTYHRRVPFRKVCIVGTCWYYYSEKAAKTQDKRKQDEKIYHQKTWPALKLEFPCQSHLIGALLSGRCVTVLVLAISVDFYPSFLEEGPPTYYR